MDKGLDAQLLWRIGADLSDVLQRRLPREHHRVRPHVEEDIGRGAVDDPQLGAHMAGDTGRMALGQLHHTQICDDESIHPRVLQKLQIGRQGFQLLLPGQSVAGHIDLGAPRMGELHCLAQALIREVHRGGAHAELTPRQIHRVRPVAQRHEQALPVPGRGQQFRLLSHSSAWQRRRQTRPRW